MARFYGKATVCLQAALSKSPEDIDNLDFESGTVSVSVDGAGQILAEEIFSVIKKWIDSRPQPQYIANVHDFFKKHLNKFIFLNYYVFPIIVAGILFLYLLKDISPEIEAAAIFGAITFHAYSRMLALELNYKIKSWVRTSDIFSMFSLTGGDHNQQAKFAAKSRNSVLKLVATAVMSFAINIISSYIFLKMFNK